MAVGFPVKADYATGDVLSAANMNDLSGSVNLLQSAQYAAGKNAIINGDFRIAQRGTSIVCASGAETPTLDRWFTNRNGTGTVTVSQQTFTPGTAPVAGYEGANFIRFDQSVAGSGAAYSVFSTKIEDVRTFAGQTVTFSFWAKTATAKTYSVTVRQNFGSGGSSSVDTNTSNFTTSTSWTRFSFTVAVPSISGKTIGTGSYLQIWFNMGLNETTIFDVWGAQLEEGSTASEFQTATGTIQGELAACQRYYYRQTGPNASSVFSDMGWGSNNAQYVYGILNMPVTMRTAPTSLDYSAVRFGDGTNFFAPTTLTILTSNASNNITVIEIYYSTGGLVQYRPYYLLANSNAAAYLGVSAEL
jgi:hypothetical protein